MDDTRARISDPYTDEDLGPAEPERVHDVPIDTGYDGTKPNPVYRGLPYTYLAIGSDGEIHAVQLKASSDVTAAERHEVHREIYNRTRRRSPDGIGSGGVSLPASAREPKIQTPAFRPARVLGSHTLTRGAAHDDGRGTVSGMDETNHSHTQDNPTMAKASKRATEFGSAGSDPIEPGTTASIDDHTMTTVPDRPALTLYDLTERWLDLEAFIEEHQDEIVNAAGDLDAVPGLSDRLEALEGDLRDKVERVVLFIENRAEIEKARRAQAIKFGRLADLDKSVIAGLKVYLVRCQRRAGLPKIETTHCRSSVVKNSQQSIDRSKDAPTLEYLYDEAVAGWGGVDAKADPELVLACLEKEITTTYSLNRAKILELWKAEHAKASILAKDEAHLRTEYDRDVYAQAVANRHPVLVTLGVEVDQGYHVRLK